MQHFFKFLINFMLIFCGYICMHMCTCVWAIVATQRPEKTCGSWYFPSTCNPKDWAQVLRLGVKKVLYTLIHLKDPAFIFVLVILIFFWDSISCSSQWLQTSAPPAWTPQILGLQACTITFCLGGSKYQTKSFRHTFYNWDTSPM